jgi:hypothetical protein
MRGLLPVERDSDGLGASYVRRTRESVRENQRELIRRRANGDLFDRMSEKLKEWAANRGSQFTRAFLFELAGEMIADRNKPALDRLARRKKGPLICWFCEHCSELLALPAPARPRAPAHPGFDLPAQAWANLDPDWEKCDETWW